MKNLLSGFVVTALFYSLGLSAADLDGKTFTGVLKDGNKVLETSESLVFKDGKFRSSACDKYGYKETEYKTKTKGDTTTFKAVATNDSGDKMTWSGKIKGTDAQATAVRSSGGEKVSKVQFKGKVE